MIANFTPRFNTLVEIFEHSTIEFRDRPLFGVKREDSWVWMSYGAFGEEVDRVRTGLAGLGVVEGDVVGIISDNRPEWAIAAYAAYGLGAAVVPMYEAQADDNWQYILGDSGAKAVFVASQDIQKRVEAFQKDLPALEYIISFTSGVLVDEFSFATLGADASDVTPPADVESGDIAGFVYTSGTTGKPKGVLLTHGNLANNVSAVTDVFPLELDDRTLSFLPWAHAFGQTVELHTVFAVGCSTAFAESTHKIVANLAEVAPTMLVSVPRIFTRIYDGVKKKVAEDGGVKERVFNAAIANAHKRQELAAEGKSSRLANLQHSIFDRVVFSQVRERFGGNLKYAISGGAAIPVEVAQFIDALGMKVYEGYGLSETSPIVTANWPGTRKIGSVGKPVPGVWVEIDDIATRDEGVGEIIVHGHCVMQGYHNLPEENEAVFTENGGFRTGDLGRLDDEGFLFIVGRIKEQYKLANGKYVVPTIIEEKIGLSPYIVNAMVYGDGRPFNVALVVLDTAAVQAWAVQQGLELQDGKLVHNSDVLELIGAEIRTQTEGIPHYERIREFALLGEDFTTENGMLTPTLKVKRRVVLDRYNDELETLYQ